MIVIAACTAHKKSTTSTASTTTVTTTTVSSTTTTTESTAIVAVAPFVKPENGIYDPREEELIALQAQYKSATLENDVTLDRLKEGYFLYAKGACTKCHEALNIYYIDPFRWGFICDNMAMKAALTPTQKTAVYQYVLAIKAAKSK